MSHTGSKGRALRTFKSTDLKPVLLLALLMFVVALFYSRSITAQPLLDDVPQMALISGAKSLWDLPLTDCYHFLRPIKNLFFAGFAWLSPWMPGIGHLLSIVLFEVCIVLLWRYFQLLFGDTMWAVAATALWALTPTQVSVVSWLSCTNVLFMTACVIGCLLFHEQAQRPPPTHTRGETGCPEERGMSSSRHVQLRVRRCHARAGHTA